MYALDCGWNRNIVCDTKVCTPVSMERVFSVIWIHAYGYWGVSSHAVLLKIKPFDNSYKKARKSYEVSDSNEDKKP